VALGIAAPSPSSSMDKNKILVQRLSGLTKEHKFKQAHALEVRARHLPFTPENLILVMDQSHKSIPS